MTTTPYTITPLDVASDTDVTQVAHVLHAGFADRSLAWPTYAAAYDEVYAQAHPTNINLVARARGQIVGWIGAHPQYDGHAWELHPIVVAPSLQRHGIGRLLVTTLVRMLQSQGASTLFAWSDDETQRTSLGGHSLYPDPLAHLRTFTATTHHAGGFYLRNGFVLSGVIPDANGAGKPDVLFVRPLTHPI